MGNGMCILLVISMPLIAIAMKLAFFRLADHVDGKGVIWPFRPAVPSDEEDHAGAADMGIARKI